MRIWMLTIMAAALMATAFSQDYKAYGDMRANDLIPTGLAITNTARAAAGLAVTNAVQGGYLCTVQAAMQLVASHATQEQLALGLAPILAQTNQWTIAYGWGNHAGLYRAVDWVPSWVDVTDKPSVYPPATHSHDYSVITNPPWLTVAAVSGLTQAPTNAVSGWMVYDSGSNIWLKVTASNLSFTVWEVSE